MPQTIPDPPKQPCWAHNLLVCTRRHGDLFWGLRLRKPNSFSHSKGRYEEGKWDNVLLCSLSSVAMSRDMSTAPHKFLAFVIAHCMCQIVSLDGASFLPCNVPGPWAVPPAVPGKGFSEGLVWHGNVKLSLLHNGGSFIPCWQQQPVLPNGTG